MLEKYLEINPEVKHALENNIPVVALESTIISHGMPYPQNAETALKVESIVRENGGIPATIGIINGKLKVGLSPDEIELLGKEGEKVAKVSRRDIPYIVANKLNGATTVASTMIIANMAGVKKVFISLGSDGVFYMNENEAETIKIPRINPASSTGAGDAFVAGIAYGEYHDYSIREATKLGLGAGILTSLSDKTVSDQMNIKNVENIIKEMEI